MREGTQIENCCLMYRYKENTDEWCHIELEVRTGLQGCRYMLIKFNLLSCRVRGL